MSEGFSFPEKSYNCPDIFLNELRASFGPLTYAHINSLSLIKPYKCATLHTLARWIKQLIAHACIDTNI